ncbi:hypothetical protein Tco_1554542 [Tanacetum coccineum]
MTTSSLKQDLDLELGKSISLTEAEEEAVAREVHVTHARIVSSDSSKKLKGIQTLTPAEQEAADIMKALKESKKMSKRQPRTGGSNEGSGNILGYPWEADVVSEHFDRSYDNAGDDNEETKPDPEEIYKSSISSSPKTRFSNSLSRIIHYFFTTNIPPLLLSSSVLEMVIARLPVHNQFRTAHLLYDSWIHQSGTRCKFSVSPTPYCFHHPRKTMRYSVVPVGFTLHQLPLIKMKQSTSTSQTNQKFHLKSLIKKKQNNVQAEICHRFDKMNLSILSVHRYKTLLSLPHAILIMKICIHFNQQSHEYQWTKDHPLEQVIDNPTNPVQTRQQLATDPEMCMFALTVSTEEPKNSKEAMADSA